MPAALVVVVAGAVTGRTCTRRRRGCCRWCCSWPRSWRSLRCVTTGAVHRGGCRPRARLSRSPASTACRRLRRRLAGDGCSLAGRDGGAADAGGVRDGSPGSAPAQAARLRHRPPGQLGVAAAAGLQPDQPAGVRRVGPLVPTVHRPDGAAVAGGDRRWSTSSFGGSSGGPRRRRAVPADSAPPSVPVFTLVVVGLTLLGFVARRSSASTRPGRRWQASSCWAPSAARAPYDARALVRSANVPFCLFVLALGVVVQAVVDNGLRSGWGTCCRRAARCSPCSGSPA